MDKHVPGHQRKERVEEVILQVWSSVEKKKTALKFETAAKGMQTPVSPDIFGHPLISSLPNQQTSSYKGSLKINKCPF